MKRFLTLLSAFSILVIFASACNLPSSGSTLNANEAVTQTLSALGTQVAAAQTALPTVPPTLAPTVPPPVTPPPNTPAPLTHVIMPGEMQATESTVDDILYKGDYFNSNVFERPYTPVQMVYRPDLDLQKNILSTDNAFFYFALNVKDINPDTKNLVGNYGVELDLNRDGRGDYLVWVSQAPTSTAWDTLGVAVYSDTNHDVGSTRPLLSDPPSKTDGYETQVWPDAPLTDADGAWARLSPSSPTTVQIAVKRSLVGSPTSFMWSAWADDLIKNPALFDYNDAFTLAEAGSPLKGASNYPLAKLALVDNTCRGAWGFTPTGSEPGLCKAAPVPTQKPVPQTTAVPTKPVANNTPVPCQAIVLAQVTDGSTWDPAWAAFVTLCIGSSCKHPDTTGVAEWTVNSGIYTITGSSPSYGITPASAQTKVGCGEKSVTQLVIGPG